MKVKPKEVMVNLPVALLFDEPWQIAEFASNINTILHGKVKVKAEDLGVLGEKYVGLFYLNRHDEFQELHDEFVRLIEEERIAKHNSTKEVPDTVVEDMCTHEIGCTCPYCKAYGYGTNEP